MKNEKGWRFFSGLTQGFAHGAALEQDVEGLV